MKRLLPLLLALPVVGVAAAPGNTSAAMVDAARSAVEARLGKGYAATSLEVTGRPSDALPAIDDGAHLSVSPIQGRFPRERFSVDVAMLRGARTVAHGTVGFALHATAQALVYGQDASRGSQAEMLDLRQGDVDVAHARSAPVVGAEALAGMRLKRPVREGQIVSSDDFETLPDVDMRQPIRLRAAFGDIVVESPGLALRSGNRGDTVTVQVQGATAPVKATVVDRGVAELVH